jgi:hypothetical protein
MADPNHKVLTCGDGKEFKGLAADVAIEQSCADCHKHQPNSVKKGDLMVPIVIRLRP